MANTLRFKRGLVAGIPTGVAGEPLFTTDTFDLYIGNGTTNTRFQQYIASGTTLQYLRGDGSLATFPTNIVTGTGVSGQVAYWSGTNTQGGDTGFTYDTTNKRIKLASTGGGQFYLEDTDATSTFNITDISNNGGNFNIGTRSSAGAFVSTDYQIVKDTVSSSYHRWFTASTERMRLTANGRLLLGTTTEGTFLLDVNGAIRSSGLITAATEFRLNNQSFTRVAITDTGGGFAGGYNLALSSGITPIHDSTGGIAGIHYRSNGTIQFYTGGSQAANTTATERMRIDANGSVGIGTTSLTNRVLAIGKTMTGTTSGYGILQSNNIASDVTSLAINNYSQFTTQSAAFTLSNAYHYYHADISVGAGSSITNQYGYFAANIVAATNNYGFFGELASGTGRWNLYMNGTASNYLAGNLGINATTPLTKLHITGGHIFANNGTGAGSGSQIYLGSLDFNNSGYWNSAPGIGAVHSTTSGVASDLGFFTYAGTPNTRTERARFFYTGNLLIQSGGTFTDSGEKLQVTGTMRVTGATRIGGVATLVGGAIFQGQSITQGFAIEFQSAAVARFYNATNALNASIFYNEAGLLFTGAPATFSSSVTAASFIPSVGSAVTNGMYLNNTNSLAFSTNSTFRLVIGSTGIVAVGIANPSAGYGDGVGVQFTASGYIQSYRSQGVSATFGRHTTTGLIQTFFYGATATSAAQIGAIGTDGDGLTFSGGAFGTTHLTIASTGAATFSSSVTAAAFVNTTQNAFLLNNSGVNNDFRLGSATSVFRVVNFANTVGLLSITDAGAATFSSSIEAGTAIAIGTTPDTNKPFKILKNINGTVGINFENTSTGSSAFSAIQMGTDVTGGTKFTNLVYASSGVTANGVYQPDGTSLINNGGGGLNFLGTPTRFYTGGSNGVVRLYLDNNGLTQLTATTPTTNETDGYRQYSADVVAGNAAPHFRTENGAVIKIYQETTGVGNAIFSAGGGTGVLDDSTFDGYTLRQIVKALRNQGILA